MKILAIVAKSSSGKSTIINKLVESFPEKFHAVKSYTTREIRENDPNDINTHMFVNKAFWEQAKDKALAVYHSPKGYVSWTDESSFDKDKINLYAIDAKALNDELYPHCKALGYDIGAIYFMISDEERKRRYIKRENSLDGFSQEEHLELWHITDMGDRLRLINANHDIFSTFINVGKEIKRLF